MQALAAAPFGRRPGLERAPAAAPESKTPRVGPWWPWVVPRPRWGRVRLKSPPSAAARHLPPTQRPARPRSFGGSSQPLLRQENPIHLQGKGLESRGQPVSAPRRDPCGVPGPAAGCRTGPHAALGATPGSAHPSPFRAPLPPALPKPSCPSCSAHSLLFCPLPPCCPLSLLLLFLFFIFFWFHLFESENQPLFLATCLAKICVAARSRRKGFPPRSFPRHRNVRTA